MIYAVKPGCGTIPGLYHTATDAKKQLNSKMSEYGEFNTVEEALRYINPNNKIYHKLFPKTDYYIYSDGSCMPKKGSSYGPGGWSTIIIDKEDKEVIELAGGSKNTTCMEMELTAIIRGLMYIPEHSSVQIFTDSNFAFDSVRNMKLYRWITGEFRNSFRAFQYPDLWKTFYSLIKNRKYQIHWIKGHVQIGKNERADELAKLGAKRFAEQKA
jgi:ribonuclease HI